MKGCGKMPDPREGPVERVIDANANRAREGLRVAEDFARFVVADEALARALRDARHRVTEIVGRIRPPQALLAARDTEGDLGADADAFPPAARGTPGDVAASALKRAEEALRSLAEFSKLVDPAAAAAFERERYGLYDLEKRLLLEGADVRRMGAVDVLAVMDAGAAPAPADVADAALEAGAGCLVAAPGALADGDAVSLAREIRGDAAGRGAVVLVAGRPDVARLAGADGVLLGPGDVPPAGARRVLGTGAVVGVKVAGADEARAAIEIGATFVVLPLACARDMASGFDGLWFASALEPGHAALVTDAGATRIALGLPDSPEEAGVFVRAARDALDKARPSGH
jgi:thiamine-phosphate pyrophosphorylase